MDLFGINNGRQNHRKGILLMTGTGLCWSTGGLFVRSVSITNSWEIALWRALAMTIVLTILLCARHPGRAIQSLTAMGFGGLLAGLCLATAFMGFILAVTQTTVANTLVIMSTSPFLAALALNELVGFYTLTSSRQPTQTVASTLAGEGVEII